MVDKTLRGGYNGASTRRRVAMPKYISFEWRGYFISTRPMGWRRFFHYPAKNIWEFPYFAGDYIKLNLSVKKHQADTLPFNLRIYEFFPGYKVEEYILNEKLVYDHMVDNIDLNKSKDIQIISKDNIAITGEGYYRAEISMEELPDPDDKSPIQIVPIDFFGQNIMTFHAHQSEKAALAIYALLWPLSLALLAWLLG